MVACHSLTEVVSVERRNVASHLRLLAPDPASNLAETKDTLVPLDRLSRRKTIVSAEHLKCLAL